MRQSNVLRFPTGNQGDGSLKLFAVVFYLFLAGMLRNVMGVSEGGLWLLMMLGVLYNIFVRHRLQKGNYFKQNGVLLAILLVLFLILYPINTLAILLLAGFYWLTVARTGRDAPYFLKFHLLTGLILNFFLLMPCLLLMATVQLVLLILKAARLSAYISPDFMLVYGTGLSWFTLALFWGGAIWLAVSALRGRTPYIPTVTDNVRHWA